MKNSKIICTLGPASFNKESILKMKNRGVNFFRINLSHTPKEEIERKIMELKKLKAPVMIDTESSQIRTGNEKEIFFKEGEIVKIYNKKIECNGNNLFFTPKNIIEKLNVGDLIHLDFNSVLIKISSIENINKDYIEGNVLIGGKIGGRKGVHLESNFVLPTFSEKDKYTIKLAKKYKIYNFSLSFIRNKEDVLEFKKLFPRARFLSKIETKDAVKNINSILDLSDGILIDRGDLSREIPLEKIPFVQKLVTKKAQQKNKEIFIATNTLENMSYSLKPTKSEINDIVNCLIDGVTGFVLTKETAVGKYPIETINMLLSIFKEFENNYEDIDLENLQSNLLPLPHGGKLVSRISKEISKEKLNSMKKILITEENLMDLEQIAVGSFSPLKGFMKKSEILSVLDYLRLPNGVIWPLPIFLQINEINDLKENEEILLEYKNEIYGTMKIEEIFQLNKEEFTEKVFGTQNKEHPGVKKFLEGGDYFLGGEINLIKRRNSPSRIYELTPKQVRQIFSERGWSKVVGFHTRNVIHKSHEYIQLKALERGLCDGLFIHPVIGKKKKGDFESEIIIKSYEKMMEQNYSKEKVFFSVLPTFSRYGGPREALFTAIIRKNFGCSHFIVGRDHTGVKNFYSPNASHKIFDNFRYDELGIIPIKFNEVFYSTLEKKYLDDFNSKNHPTEKKLNISGTKIREMLKQRLRPPQEFMRPEISELIINYIKEGKRVFVEED